MFKKATSSTVTGAKRARDNAIDTDVGDCDDVQQQTSVVSKKARTEEPEEPELEASVSSDESNSDECSGGEGEENMEEHVYGGDAAADLESDEDVECDGTTTDAPNPVAARPKRKSILTLQPNDKWPWATQLTPQSIREKWAAGPILSPEDSDHKSRNFFYHMFAPNMKYTTTKTQTPPLFVKWENMSGLGAKKFKATADFMREYAVGLSPRIPEHLYNDSVAIQSATGDTIEIVRVSDPGAWEYLKQVETTAMIFFNGLVQLHIQELVRMFENSRYKVDAKATQRAEVLQAMELTLNPETNEYTSTHATYKDMPSYRLKEELKRELIKRWLFHAVTPFGCAAKRQARQERIEGKATDSSSDTGAPSAAPFIPDLSSNFDFGPGIATTAPSSPAQSETDAPGAEQDDSELYDYTFDVETGKVVKKKRKTADETLEWYQKDKNGNYGGAYPGFIAKRRTFFGDINEKNEDRVDKPGCVPWEHLAAAHQQSVAAAGGKSKNAKLPEWLTALDNKHAQQSFRRNMDLYKQTLSANKNFVPTCFKDPYMRPMSAICSAPLEVHDVQGGPVTRGSIASFSIDSARTLYPESMTTSYGTAISLNTDVLLYAIAPLDEEQQRIKIENARITTQNQNQSSGAKIALLDMPKVDRLQFVSDAFYEFVPASDSAK